MDVTTMTKEQVDARITAMRAEWDGVWAGIKVGTYGTDGRYATYSGWARAWHTEMRALLDRLTAIGYEERGR